MRFHVQTGQLFKKTVAGTRVLGVRLHARAGACPSDGAGLYSLEVGYLVETWGLGGCELSGARQMCCIGRHGSVKCWDGKGGHLFEPFFEWLC